MEVLDTEEVMAIHGHHLVPARILGLPQGNSSPSNELGQTQGA
jgi:hypothetical protein